MDRTYEFRQPGLLSINFLCLIVVLIVVLHRTLKRVDARREQSHIYATVDDGTGIPSEMEYSPSCCPQRCD